MIPPFIVFITPLLMLSTILALSSSSWIIVWVFLEMNMFTFLPFISNPPSLLSTESTVKYFVVQALGSSAILLSTSVFTMQLMLMLKPIFTVGICMKAGLAPTHQWLISVSKTLNKVPFLMLMSWQKLAPLYIMAYHISSSLTMFILSVMNAIIGVMGALKQTLLRPLLTFSSINHGGWMILAMTHSLTLFMMYATIYFIMFLLLVVSLKKSLLHYWTSPSLSPKTVEQNLSFTMNIISMAGIPPLMGFAMKWLTLWMTLPHPFIILILLSTSALGLLYYLTLSMSSIFHSIKKTNFSHSQSHLSHMMFHILTPLIIIAF